MTSVIQAPGTARGEPTCGCPTSNHPGSLVDRIDTHHRPSCPAWRALGLHAGDSLTTCRYAAGTLDRRLDDAFGPVTR